MRWSSSVSTRAGIDAALDEALEEAAAGLDGAAADLALLFVTHHHRGGLQRAAPRLAGRLGAATTLGCAASGVIGAGREVEDRLAVSLTLASLPNVALRAFHVDEPDLPSPDVGPAAWRDLLGVPEAPRPAFLLLADPSSFDPRGLLEGLDFAYPGAVVVGGLASGRRSDPLLLGRTLEATGAVGVALQGDVRVEAVVAQGCRALGLPMTVTKVDHNVILELDGRPPLELLSEVYAALEPEDQELVQRALHLGIASTGLGGPDAAPDYLIRNVIGADPERGALAVGSIVRAGQTVRFHVRDAATARDDLRERLARQRQGAPQGALLFQCTGRGQQFFGRPDHDSGLARAALGRVPLGGFFCGGEIGPVGGVTHLHGYTSALALFSPGPT